MDLTEVFRDVTVDDIKSIMVGVSIDLNKVDDIPSFRNAAIHCVLNGPVGVNKMTSFPGNDDEIKIKDLYQSRLSNKMWRNFCSVVAEHLIRNYPDIVETSQQYKLYGNVWPVHEDNE